MTCVGIIVAWNYGIRTTLPIPIMLYYMSWMTLVAEPSV